MLDTGDCSQPSGAAENETDAFPRFLETYPPVQEMENTLVKKTKFNCMLEIFANIGMTATCRMTLGCCGRERGNGCCRQAGQERPVEEGTFERRPECKDPVFQKQGVYL